MKNPWQGMNDMIDWREVGTAWKYFIFGIVIGHPILVLMPIWYPMYKVIVNRRGRR
jgi:hypothetical protein